jgi:single-stranded DNA-binding protein
MNYVDVCAVLNEKPREVYTSATSSNLCAEIVLPPVGNKATTPLIFHVYGKACDKFKDVPKGSRIYIHGAKLRFDIESKTYSLHGGVIAQVTEAFPVFNDVILTGRCIKDIDQTDARAFKTTADGLMIANQTLSVNTGRNQADLFNFYAINSAQDKLNNAELLVNFTRKGTGITIRGRLVTDAWTDKESQERKSLTKIQLVQMTLAPKASESQTKSVTTQTTVASTEKVASLWGNKTVEESTDPWTQASGGGLPDLPGQYGNAPNFDDNEPPF